MAATSGKKKSKINFSEEINATINPIKEVEKKPSEPIEKEAKNKGGRPSKGDVKRISLAIDADLFEGLEIGASLFFKGNKTAFINALIRKDLEENLEAYKTFKNMTQHKQ